MEYIKRFFEIIFSFFSNRIIILILFMCIAFSVLIRSLYQLQIQEGQFYARNLRETTVKTLDIEAERGEIFDKYGIPLAYNDSSFTITMDPQVPLTNKELLDVIYNVLLLFERKGESYIDELPISKDEPLTFTLTDNQILAWKKDMAFSSSYYDANPEDTIMYLLRRFDIVNEDDDGNIISDYEEKYWRSMLSIRVSHYTQRYRKYNSVNLAVDVKDETMTEIEEQPFLYKGIHSKVDVTRNYPEGEHFSHLLGYILKINQSEYESYSEVNSDYTPNDLVGKDGLEKYFELDLKGEKGTQKVELNNVGKITNVLDVQSPTKGLDIYTTVDSTLTENIYNLLEEYLTRLIIANMETITSRDRKITSKDFFYNFAKANNFMLSDIEQLDDNSASKKVQSLAITHFQNMLDEYDALSEKAKDILSLTKDDKDKLNLYSYYLEYDMENQKHFSTMLSRAIDEGEISEQDLLLSMYELEIITLDDNTVENIKNNKFSSLEIVKDKLRQGEITPQMTNLDPYSGSVMVVDVKTGNILSAVNYPSFDNNKLVNNFDDNYYYKISQLDPTTPLLNRAFIEGRAPGSTFKMLTGVAVLEESNMTPTTTIYDKTYYTKAGSPYPRCWSSHSHGATNIYRALEVSCNYYFFESSFNLGNANTNSTLTGITALNKYMEYFGLNDRTGVELTELADFSKDGASVISSPEYKKEAVARNFANPSEGDMQWYDGDTITTAIGQGYNNYTNANMVKYIATLANDGKRHQLHFLDKKTDVDGNVVERFEPVLETTVPMSEENHEAVLKGMRQVIVGSSGTGRSAYRNFPIPVAGKSGTAEENKARPDHSSFAVFAPYENPEVAVYVMLPFGNSYTFSSPASKLSRAVLDEYFNFNYEPEKRTSDNLFIK